MSKKRKRQASHRMSPAASTPRGSEFNPDYAYVRRDLRRIGLLAGSFFVILVVLSFFLR